MLLKNINNKDSLFKVIDECKGKVELVTGEGDRLNLKSQLCKYVAFASVFADESIPEIEIVTYDPEDTMRLVKFAMMN